MRCGRSAARPPEAIDTKGLLRSATSEIKLRSSLDEVRNITVAIVFFGRAGRGVPQNPGNECRSEPEVLGVGCPRMAERQKRHAGDASAQGDGLESIEGLAPG